MTPQIYAGLKGVYKTQFKTRGLAVPVDFIETVEPIRKAVSEVYNIDVLHHVSRKRNQVWARITFAHYVVKHCVHPTLAVVGRYLGGVHHATIIHYERRGDDMLEFDKEFQYNYNQFLELL